MKHKKSNIFITKRGTLGTFLNDGYYYEIVGVQTYYPYPKPSKYKNKYPIDFQFKYR